MRIIQRSSLVLAATIGLIGSAAAADLTGAEIKEFVSGKTVYLETTAASIAGSAGQGMIYYSADGTSLYKTPKGEMLHGTWVIKDNTLCTNWKEIPNNPCTRYDKQGDVVSILNAANGQTRAKITKTAAGNPEKLAP